MLVLSRKKNESIVINDNITIVVVEIRGDKVRLGVEAPKETPVHRKEVYDAIKREEVSRDKPQVATADATVTATVTATATATGTDATATKTASTDEDVEDNAPMRPPPRNNMMDVVAVTLGYVCIVGLSGLGGYTVITWINDLLKPWMK